MTYPLRLPATAAMCAIAAAALFLAAGPVPSPFPSPFHPSGRGGFLPDACAGTIVIPPPTPTVIAANDEEKAAVLDDLKKADAEKSDEVLLRALTVMVERKHADFVPAIVKALEHSDQDVVSTAIRAAATHELRDQEKRVRKLLVTKPKNVQKGATNAVPGRIAAACIDYLARLDIKGEEETVFKDQLRLFIGDEKRIRSKWGPEMLSSSLHYLGKQKYKKAVGFIIEELLAEPVPSNPNDPKNPPASYWEGRHSLWQNDGEGWARWTLKEITGQEFRSVREWQAWLKLNEKDLEKGK